VLAAALQGGDVAQLAAGSTGTRAAAIGFQEHFMKAA
jgi:hypothetical protein